MNNFSSHYDDIIDLVDSYKVSHYAKTRNFLDGGVSYLSPYISRGIISTRTVYNSLIKRGYALENIEKFVQELAWRDYWQSQWDFHGDKIDSDLNFSQKSMQRHGLPNSLINVRSSIDVFNVSIEKLYKDGYMHNHMRMYVAMSICNIGAYHWHEAAKWMYYHLLDGDWASNALSWQWVAGCLNDKKYIANQENINKYCRVNERGTYLDKSYDDLAQYNEVDEMLILADEKLIWKQIHCQNPESLVHDDTLIFNYYNLDPKWRSEQVANRILLIEPKVFERYPISEKVMTFFLDLSKNINDLIIFVGDFSELKNLCRGEIYYRQHPLNDYLGVEDQRESLSSVKGNYSSFYKFWKKCKRQLLEERN
ncbi:FAD-binding domain-containing protein [Lentisphaera profundi]|uniref:FAD-binding domain-containing protein n=1 Tax=Lentisphaera profundi TaxID=1658616 RepID=A0ABY7VUH4_9BACT|nr:FAD-binding domain-containing protein [Lentisphaera profundi]WDE97372.1 FAD-binding domain-containing protein [Lentisphaera profundi]